MDWFGIGTAVRAVWSVLSMPIGGSAKAQAQNTLMDAFKQQLDLNNTLMTNHIAHLDAKQEAQTEALIQISDTLRVTATTLQELHGHIRSDHERCAASHQEMTRDLARIDGRLDR